jgi:phosphoribosylformylglycinamidine synthase
VTGGNVSFYNQTGADPILPTPVVGVLGVIDDVTRRVPVGFAAEGDAIVLIGETRDEFAGSAWADVAHSHLGGLPPQVDFAHEKLLAEVLVQASRRGLLSSAHDLSEGGLAQALVESCLRRGYGASVDLPADLDPFVALFAESAGRVLASLPQVSVAELTRLCQEVGLSVTVLGTVQEALSDAALTVGGQFTLALTEIREAWEAPIPTAMLNDPLLVAAG